DARLGIPAGSRDPNLNHVAMKPLLKIPSVGGVARSARMGKGERNPPLKSPLVQGGTKVLSHPCEARNGEIKRVCPPIFQVGRCRPAECAAVLKIPSFGVSGRHEVGWFPFPKSPEVLSFPRGDAISIAPGAAKPREKLFSDYAYPFQVTQRRDPASPTIGIFPGGRIRLMCAKQPASSHLVNNSWNQNFSISW